MYTRLIAVVLLAACSALSSSAATAHPLGNFSISHYSGIRVNREAVELKYIIDMAEIPTFQEIQESGITAKLDDPSLRTYLSGKAELLRDGLSLKLGGKPIALRIDSKEIIFPSGAGGLPTMKLGIVFKGKLAGESLGGEQALEYRDGNFPGRAGWKEIVATAAPGVKLLNSSVSDVDRSAQLSDYPTDLLNSPPQQLEARVNFSVASLAPAADNSVAVPSGVVPRTAAAIAEINKPDSARSSKEISPEPRMRQARSDMASTSSTAENSLQLKANSQSTPRSSFTEIMAKKDLGLGIVLAALAIAVGLGAFHALEPGHGKTLVAAYLIGSRGTTKHALLLGLIVTVAHTAGVYLLGAITLYASNYIVPERLYPWLALSSGLMIMTVGCVLFVRRYRSKEITHHHHYGHDYGHGHHHHHDHGHVHHHHGEHSHDHPELKQDVSLKQLLALGISGGIVPCPAALVVLLSAVAMQRIGFGLLLILAFSVGLAAVLIGVGMLMVYARQFMSRFHGDGLWTTRWLPITSSAFILLAGVALTAQALQTIPAIN